MSGNLSQSYGLFMAAHARNEDNQDQVTSYDALTDKQQDKVWDDPWPFVCETRWTEINRRRIAIICTSHRGYHQFVLTVIEVIDPAFVLT